MRARARIQKLSQPWEVFEFTNSNCWLCGWSFKKAPCYFISFIKRPLLEPLLHTFVRALSITSTPKIYYGNGVHYEDVEIMGILRDDEFVQCALIFAQQAHNYPLTLPDVSGQGPLSLHVCTTIYTECIGVFFICKRIYIYMVFRWTQRIEVFVVYRTFIS